MIGNPLGLLALLSIPVIVGIHFFRRRFKPRPIAGLFLWADPDRDPSSGRRLHRIENRLSLWLELLLALLLSLYILDFRWDTTTALPHHVIVLDSTASMAARDADYDVSEAAREKVRDIATTSGPEALVTLISGTTNPVVLCGPAAALLTVEDALLSWRATGRGEDHRAAIALGRELAGPDARIHFVSDHAPSSSLGSLVQWHAVGRAMDNAAILSAERRQSPDEEKEEIFVVVASWGQAGEVAVEIAARDTTLARQDVSTDGRGRPVTMRLTIPTTEGPVTLKIADDALSIDNEVRLVKPADRVVTYRLSPDLPKPLAEDLRRALRSLPETLETDAPFAHLVFGAGTRPEDLAATSWYVGFGPFVGRLVPHESGVELGPFLVEGAHPLLSDVDFSGVVWTYLKGGGEGFRRLVSAGNVTLLGERSHGQSTELRFNIDYAGSNFRSAICFPIIVFNLVHARQLEIPGCSRDLASLGETISVSLVGVDSGTALQLIDPQGNSRPLFGKRRLEIGPMRSTGYYRIENAGEPWAEWEVRFRDPEESNLTNLSTREFAVDDDAGVQKTESDVLIDPRLHFTLLFAGLALFVANALFIKKGRTQ